MKEMPIGIVWRFGKNYYQISLFKPNKEEERQMNDILTAHDNDCSSFRGRENLTLKDANVGYWEDEFRKQDEEEHIRSLVAKLFEFGNKYDILVDMSDPENSMTREEIDESLRSYKGTAYLMETFFQWMNNEMDNEEFGEYQKVMFDLIHHAENLKEG